VRETEGKDTGTVGVYFNRNWLVCAEVPGVDFSYQRVHTTKQRALYAEETKNAEYRKINKLRFLFLGSYLSAANRALDVGRDLVVGL